MSEAEALNILEQGAIVPEQMSCHSDDRWLAYIRERVYERVVRKDLDAELPGLEGFASGVYGDEDLAQLVIGKLLERKGVSVGYQVGVINPMYRGKVLRPVGIEVFRTALQELLYGNEDFDAPLIEGYRKLTIGGKILLNSILLHHYIGVKEGGSETGRFYFFANSDIAVTKKGISFWPEELQKKWGTRPYIVQGSYPDLEAKIEKQLSSWKVDVKPLVTMLSPPESYVKMFVEVDTGMVPLHRAASVVDEKIQVEAPMLETVMIGQYREEKLIPFTCKQSRHIIEVKEVKAIQNGRRAVEISLSGCRGVLCGECKPAIMLVHTRGKVGVTLTPVIVVPGALADKKVDQVLASFEKWEQSKVPLLTKLVEVSTMSPLSTERGEWHAIGLKQPPKALVLNELLQKRKKPMSIYEIETQKTLGADVHKARIKVGDICFPWSAWQVKRDVAQRQATWMAVRQLEKVEPDLRGTLRVMKANICDFTLHGQPWAAVLKVAGGYTEELACVPYREVSEGETTLFLRSGPDLDAVLKAVQGAGFFIMRMAM